MRIDLPIELIDYPEIALPTVWTVEQRFSTPSLSGEAVEREVGRALEALRADPRLRPGARVAIGVGSRGLDQLPRIVRAVVGALRALGAEPFLVPAMGSHGGATAEGQAAVLRGYGVAEDAVGAPIEATMDVVEAGVLEGEDAGIYAGHPVWCDARAAAADAIILVNRLKPHTDFVGSWESGIAKMCTIGLGKREGAQAVHRHGATGLRELVPLVARAMARRLPIVGGVALVENEEGCAFEIHGLRAAEIGSAGEMALALRARDHAPRLPFDALDVLVVDLMGKDVSGTGFDTHVIGRSHMPSIAEGEWGGPDIRVLAVLDLTPASHGNALGLGLADLATAVLVEKVDWRATFINLCTSREGGVLRGRIPWIARDAEACVRTAIATCGRGDASRVRLARIRHTGDLRRLEVSRALLEEVAASDRLRLAGDAEGHVIDLAGPLGGPEGRPGD